MKYYILKHKNDRTFKFKNGETPYFCRVEVPDVDANVFNSTFDDFLATGCYGSYKVLEMTKEQFEKGTVTPIVKLSDLPQHIICVVGYTPY
jgi:hypothetical protein